MHILRTALVTASLVALPSAAWAQTTTSTSDPTSTTTTTTMVTRIEDVVCSEPVNNVATCLDPEGRIVIRVDDPRQVTTTVAQPQQPPDVQPRGDVVARDGGSARPTAGRQLALTG